MMNESSQKIAVIGSGLAGLSAAIHLAVNGNEVDIYEQNDYAGGKLGEICHSGYRFDTGPSVITMPFIAEMVFQNAGFNLSDYITLESVEPINRNFFPSGNIIDTYSNIEKMQSELAKISPKDAEKYPSYYEHIERIYKNAAEVFMFSPISEFMSLWRQGKIPSLFNLRHIDAFRTVHQSNASFFKNREIQMLFDRYATYNGSNPYKAPATLNIIPYVELQFGCFYIKGGIRRLAEALTQVALKLGCRFHFNTKVSKILNDGRKVTGIEIENTKIEYSKVIANSDVVETFNYMIDGFDKVKKRLNKLEPSLSGFVMMLGIEGDFKELLHHNVFFTEDYKEEFQKIFIDQTYSNDPTIYLAITQKTDITDAPVGSENWFVLLNMPYIKAEHNFKEISNSLRKIIIDKFVRFGFDINNKINYEKIITPEDLYQKFGSNRGSIYGISSNSRFAAFSRPANRSRAISGLYFAGGSTHPGGGIPLVLLSGKIAAELAMD
jgi:phytoene desaturase